VDVLRRADAGAASVVGGVASLTASNLPVGTDAITAVYVYSGDAENLGSSSNVVIDAVVAAPATTTVLTAAPAAAAGAPIALKATVMGQGSTGTVMFYRKRSRGGPWSALRAPQGPELQLADGRSDGAARPCNRA